MPRARAAANLEHPNIIPIHEVGEPAEGQHYFSMKLVNGGNLKGQISRLVDDPLAAVEVMEQICRAVNHAHGSGLLHRDLKPSNILIDKGFPYITDFGLVKQIGSESLTQSGQLLGTPNYMSPEQAACRKELVSEASDIYALGAMLYELLTGKPPFAARTPLETLRLVENSSPKRPRMLKPDVDPELESIALKCLEKDPRNRYQTAGHLADELHVWLDRARSQRESFPRTGHPARQRLRRVRTTVLVVAIALVPLAGLAVIGSAWLHQGIDPTATRIPSPATDLAPSIAGSRIPSAAPERGVDATPAVELNTPPAVALRVAGSSQKVAEDDDGAKSVDNLLSELRSQGKARIAEELKSRIDRARAQIKVSTQFKQASIIVGRILVEGSP